MKKSLFFALLLTIVVAAPAIAQQTLEARSIAITQLISTYKMRTRRLNSRINREKTSAFLPRSCDFLHGHRTRRRTIGRVSRLRVGVLKTELVRRCWCQTWMRCREEKNHPLRQQSQDEE
jgi:hypothetical protein